MPNFGLFGVWASWQKMLLDLVSSFFLYSFRFHRMILMNQKNILWWFGGNWSINGRDSAIFMPNFGHFWSVWASWLLDLVSSNFFFVSIFTVVSRMKTISLFFSDAVMENSIHCYLHNNGPSTTQFEFIQEQIISRGKRNLFMTYNAKIPWFNGCIDNNKIEWK